MSRQVDKKYKDLGGKFSKVLNISGFKKQGDFAIEAKISPGTLSKALERDSLSEDIVDKIYDRFNVRKEYWEDGKEPIIIENGTPAMKSTDSKEKGLSQVYQDLVESRSEYRLVPKILLDDYEIISKREAEERKKIVDAALQSKQDLINQLKSEIDSLRATPQPVRVHAQQAK